MGRDIRNFILAFAIALLSIAHLDHCKDPTSPERTLPEEPKFYTIQVSYTRPAGSVLKPEYSLLRVHPSIISAAISEVRCSCHNPDVDLFFKEIVNDHIVYESESRAAPDNENALPYAIRALDEARWDGVNDDTAVVGDIFIIKVKESGFEKQLTNVVYNCLDCNPYKGPAARMALFRLMKDGTIREE